MSENWAFAGEMVKRERLRNVWSMRDACAAADVSPGTWVNIEKGLSISDLSMVRIENAYGWPEGSFARLLDGEDPDTFVMPGEPAARRYVTEALESVHRRLDELVTEMDRVQRTMIEHGMPPS